MIYTIEEISRRIKPVAEQFQLSAVYLFGSYAKGTATEISDIDLIVDTSGTAIKGLFALGELYSALESALGKTIDVVTVRSLQQPAQMHCNLAFRENVWKEKVRLYPTA